MHRMIIALGLLISTAGCSTLGLNVSTPQNLLTEQAESVVDRAPRQVMLPRELNKTVLAAHFLQPGDVLLIEPVRLDSEVRLPADQRVLADGTIDLSQYGRVVVAGLTLEAAEVLIEKNIKDQSGKSEQVNVRLLEQVHRIYVLGEVASPGSYPFNGNETVLDGILVAGGLTSRADACRIILARPTAPPSCRVALPICYREITQLGDTTTNYQLQPGDRIFVASRSWCDDLAFWRSKETCDRCCKCQTPCPDPSIADYANPISSTLPPPPPMRIYGDGTMIEDDAQKPIDAPESAEPEDAESAAAGESDALPPIRRLNPPTSVEAESPSDRQPGDSTPGSSGQGGTQGQLEFDPPLPDPQNSGAP